jgi:protein-tyrosine phosphatase
MAEAYFREVVRRLELRDVTIGSRGTLGIDDAPASPEAIEAMREIGIDLTAHRSSGVDEAAVRDADVVVGMSHHHLVWLAHHHPEGDGERLLLRAFEDEPDPDPNPRDLEDPIGKKIDVYREQRALIVRCLDHLGLWLKNRS